MNSPPTARPTQQSAEVTLISKPMRMEWTDAVAFDPEVSDSALRVACVIGGHFNHASGYTYINQQTIALLAKKTDRSVRAAVAELERLGYLVVERRELGTRVSDGRRVCGGKGMANAYRPAFKRERLSVTDRGRKLVAAVERRIGAANKESSFLLSAENRASKEEPGFLLSDDQRRKNAAAKEEAAFLPTLSKINPKTRARPDHQLGDAGDLLWRRIGDQAFEHWFLEVRFGGVDGDTVTLSAPSAFVRSWLIQQHQQAIIACWQRMHSRRIERVEIVVRNAIADDLVLTRGRTQTDAVAG